MQQELKIHVDDRHFVYGRLHGSLKQPLVIIVHGLPCSITENLYENAANWFEKHGYCAYRFNLYGAQKDARQLIDSTLRSHADDLDAVVRYFRRKGAKKIFVAGHSFGGPTILSSREQKFNAAVLWDPSYDISFTREKYGYPGGRYFKQLGGYFMRWGVNVIIGKAMAEEIDRLKWDELPKKFRPPLKIIAAGNGILVEGAQRYFEEANEPKSIAIVKNATHYFDDQDGMQQQLCRLSKSWFDTFR